MAETSNQARLEQKRASATLAGFHSDGETEQSCVEVVDKSVLVAARTSLHFPNRDFQSSDYNFQDELQSHHAIGRCKYSSFAHDQQFSKNIHSCF